MFIFFFGVFLLMLQGMIRLLLIMLVNDVASEMNGVTLNGS
jgi:hypothetical protein